MASTHTEGSWRSSVKKCFKRCSTCWCFAPPPINVDVEQPAPTTVSPPHHLQPDHEKLAANLAAPQPTTSPCVSTEQSAANLAPMKSPAASDPQQNEQPAPALSSAPLFSQLKEQDLKDKVKHLTVPDLDELVHYIEATLKRLAPSTSSSSNLVTDVLSECKKQKDVASCFIQMLPENLTKEVKGASENIFLPLLKQSLGGMAGVHWAGLGLSLIAWSLDNMDRTSQNQERCLELLQKAVSLLSNIRRLVALENIHNDHDFMQALEFSTEIAVRCAIICSGSLNQTYLARFFKAASVEEVITEIERELEEAKVSNVLTGTTALLEKMPKAHGPITFTLDDEGIVGGAEEMQEIYEYLNKDCNVVAVCLHGMGGIGKSTRAFSIFKKFQAMELDKGYCCCRVVLELETKSSELPDFQWKILQKICKGETPKFSDVEEGKEIMKRELEKSSAIVLYLDNVMKPGHLLQLLPKSTYFPYGSKILITTRDRNVFDDFKELKFEHCECIEVKKLEKEVAKELFLTKIGRDYVGSTREEGTALQLEKLEEEVLELCDGLPLALKVVGGFIANREMDVNSWREVVENMKGAIPLQGELDDDPLYSRLSFSINHLHAKYRAAFLDIVVYAVNKSWEFAERLVGKLCLEELLRRSLIQKRTSRIQKWPPYVYRDVMVVEVHDVMYTIGKQMASHDHSEIRITGEADFLTVNNESLKSIVGLREVKISNADLLQQMPRLRVLDDVKITVECPTFQPQHLKIINIHNSIPRPFDFSACSGLKQLSWISYTGVGLEVLKGLKQLEALEFYPKGGQFDIIQAMPSLIRLKELKLCGFRKIPEEIRYLTALTFLDLRTCKSMLALPKGIGNLTGLKELDLSWCINLASLPEGMGNLTSLKVLSLYGCASLALLPEGMGNLTGLKELHLSGCRSLASLPEGMGNLTSLKELNLVLCRSLASLPEGFGNLTGLKELYLRDCKSLASLPEGFGNLTGLKELHLSECKSLASLPEGMGNLTGLKVLNLSWCRSLASLPEGIGNLTGLKELDLRGCERLQSLPEGMGNLNLTKMGAGLWMLT